MEFLIVQKKTRPSDWKRRMLFGAHSFLYRSGAASAYAALTRASGAAILMYHSVAEDADAAWVDPSNHISPAVFRRQIAFLARKRRVISMDELVAAMADGRTQPAGSVVVTIDDGYLDTLSVAAPILAEFGVPAIVYLATGYVDRAENQWIDQLYSLFRHRGSHILHMPWENETRDLRSSENESHAYRCIAERLILANLDARNVILASIAEQLAPSRTPPRLTLCWDEVRRLKADYPLLSVGGHTRDHLDLNNLDVRSAATEIAACARDIEANLGERPRHFSYPYNRASPALRRILQEKGFVSGVASGPDTLIGPGAPLFQLPRIEAPESLARLGFYTSGAYPRLSILATGRA
jgi:peptidoglycan/xylan/chitin deacetylase (PgdA/CDA1 family)